MRSLLLVLLLACPALAQQVTMPQSVPVAVGRLAAVEMSYDGTDFKYSVPPELDAFREFTTDPKAVRLRVIGYTPGMFRIVAVTTKDDKLSEFASCVVIVGTPTTPPVTIPPVVTPPVVTPPVTVPVPADKVTAVVLIYEKDQHVVWPAVMSALNRLNRERGIMATLHEVDTKSGKDRVPEQYKEAVPAAIAAGLPALVTMAGIKALKAVKNPTTEAAILEAVP